MILGLHLRGYQFVVARILLQRNREKMSLPRAVVKEYLIHIYAWYVVVKYQGGQDYNKKRHWQQKHPEQPPERYAEQIVPRKHELARKLVAERMTKETSALQSSAITPNVTDVGSKNDVADGSIQK
jgi:hypothetical protein